MVIMLYRHQMCCLIFEHCNVIPLIMLQIYCPSLNKHLISLHSCTRSLLSLLSIVNSELVKFSYLSQWLIKQTETGQK